MPDSVLLRVSYPRSICVAESPDSSDRSDMQFDTATACGSSAGGQTVRTHLLGAGWQISNL